MSQVIQACCELIGAKRLDGTGNLPVLAARVSIPAVRLAYETDPAAYARFYLAAGETAELVELRFPQRRFPWLAARVAAKGLYCSYAAVHGASVAPSQVEAYRLQDGPRRGKPLLRVTGARGVPDLSDVSLSHAGGWACCALAREGRVGIDVEPLEEASSSFWETAYTPAERQALADLPGPPGLPERARLLWVMKESFLKALGVGFAHGLGSLRLHAVHRAGAVFTTTLAPPGGAVRMYYGFFAGHVFCITSIGEK